MPICDRSRIRPDVLKLMDAVLKEQTSGILEFLKAKENQRFNFQVLYQRLMKGNELFFKRRGDQTWKDLANYFTKDEVLFLAKVFRHGFDHMANIEQKRYPIPENVRVEPTDAGGVPAEWQTVPGGTKDRVLLYLHGGGFVMGSANSHRLFTITLGQLTKMRVLSLNYRLAPEHSYPAQLEDCTAAYRWLLSTGIKPKNIVIAGDSAGGSLTLTTLVKLRDDKIPLPIGAICLSPATDCTISRSDSLAQTFWENAATDPVLADIGLFWWIPAYLGGADPSDPLVSPINADLKGLPPLLVQASTCEMLFGGCKDIVDRAKAAGVNATLQTWDNMVHVFQAFGLHDFPEAKEAIDKITKFVQKLFK
jgi:monoterpene epsilon-lactone hydrolase